MREVCLLFTIMFLKYFPFFEKFKKLQLTIFTNHKRKPIRRYRLPSKDVQELQNPHIIVNFIIQKLKSKHTSLKKYTNRAKLTEQN